MNRIMISIVFTGIVAGCGSDGGFETEKSRLSAARLKWRQSKTSDVGGYFFNSRVSCFCPDLFPVQITVQNDTITSVKNIQARNFLSAGDFINFKYKTIDGWFRWIDSSLDCRSGDCRITYNDTRGYPEEVFFDFNKETADDEMEVKIDSVYFLYRIVL